MADIADQQAIPPTLQAIRARLDLTQEQLAERLGVSFATVNRWEGGVTTPQRAARTAIAALAAEAGIDSTEPVLDEAESAASVTRRRSRRRQAPVPTTKPMEQMLWDAACSIRGEKDAAKFKDYLLPLLFLKRLSDVFDDEIDRLAQEYGDRAVAQEIAESDHELLRFYLPPEARWGVVSGREAHDWPLDTQGRSTRPHDVGEHLTMAVRTVVRHNPTLSGVIDLVDFASERNGERDLNPARLAAVVETFSDPRYRLGLADVQPDFLGRAYEYLLRKFAEGSGQSAGEFFTPTEVGFLMAHIMRPRPGETCHDYACGSAGLLIKLQLVAQETDPTSKVPLRLYGQELQADSYAVAHMNATIHDMDVRIERGDSMINPKFKDAAGRITGHDIVVANPMWNQDFNQDTFENDPFDRFRTAGGVTTGKGDWAWLQHTLACLNERGRAAGGPGHRRGDARLRQQERGPGAQHPQVVRRPRPDRRRDPAAGQPLLQHQRRRHHRRAVQAQAGGAQGQDCTRQRQPARGEGPPQELHSGRGHPPHRRGLPERRAGGGRGRHHHPGAGGGGRLQPEPEPVGRASSRWRRSRYARHHGAVRGHSCRRGGGLSRPSGGSLEAQGVGAVNSATVRLSDLCDLIAEPVRPGTQPDALYLGLEHCASRRLVRIGSGLASEMRSTTSAFQPGDVLYGKLRPYLDKAVLADRPGVCTTELLVLRAKAHVDPRFLAAVVHSPSFLEYAVAGTTGVQHPRTSWAHTREFEVPAFAFDEQQQIADLLWLVHEAISRSEALVEEATQALKRAAMHTLFTRGLRGEAQKETEIGPVPESWEFVRVEEHAKAVSKGSSPK